MVNYDKALKPGTVLRGAEYVYRIDRVLGQGTFGITYLAFASVTVEGKLGKMKVDAPFAVKEFFMRDINEREGSEVSLGSKGGLFANYRHKFDREARTLGQLKHDGIVEVVEMFEANGTSYYSMEYCSGGSLDQLISDKGCLTEDEALGYFAQIASALQFMHEHRMLHLDLKPGNVVMRDTGKAVLIDFGLSKQFDKNGVPEESTSIGGGTPGYAPIEQSNYREGGMLPVMMDVYALGATLYKMLSGTCPPVASEVMLGFPEQPLRIRGVSDKTIAAIRRAMEAKPADRYQSVAEFAKALLVGSVGGDEDTVVEPPEPPVPPVPPVPPTPPVPPVDVDDNNDGKHKGGRKKWVLSVAIVAVSIVIGAFVGIMLGWGDDPVDSVATIDYTEEPVQEPVGYTAEEQYNRAVECENNGDYSGAVEWYRLAADRGYAEAQCNLGWCYEKGQGVGQSWTEAARWYRLAADNGEKTAQCNLGWCYENGKGVAKDVYEAVKWYRKSATQGFARAQLNIGLCYHEGRGVATDYSEAAKWLRKAANQGNSLAQAWMGYCYENGHGVAASTSDAVEWYRKAAEQGESFAKDRLDALGYSY